MTVPRVATWMVILLAGVGLAACGSSSSSSSSSSAGATSAASGTTTTTSGKPAYCGAVSDLEASVKSLSQTNVVQNGTKALKSAVQDVKTKADAAVTAVSSTLAPQADALKTATDGLSKSVQAVAGSP